MPAASWSSSALQPRLAPRAVTPDAISIMSARAGGEIARLPLGEAATFRAGAPYWVVHRADLQAALRAAGRRASRHRPAAWLPVRGCHQACQRADRGAAARQFAPAGARGGADRRRRHLVVGAQSSVSGYPAAILRPDRLARHARRHRSCRANIPRRGCSSGWDRTRIWSPIRSRAARRINVVAIVPGPGTGRAGAPPAMRARSRTPLPPRAGRSTARMLIGAVDEWRRWALFTLPEIGGWSEGSVALLGDAAHAMLPFAAQGAGMAIEDAAVLANALSDSAGENISGIPAALKRYGRLRRARVRRVAAARGCRDASTTSRERRRSRATSRSGRWVPSACWHGRTGSTTGGSNAVPGQRFDEGARLAEAAGAGGTAVIGVSGDRFAAFVALPGLLGEFLLARAPRCNRCGRRPPPPRSRQRRSRPWPSTPAVRQRASPATCARSRAACNRTDHIWRDRRTPTTWFRPSARSRKWPRRTQAAPLRRQRAAILHGGNGERTSGLGTAIMLRLAKAAADVGIEAVRAAWPRGVAPGLASPRACAPAQTIEIA